MTLASNPLFINTVLLGGTPEDKLTAASAAGFQQIELWQQDVENAGGDCTGIKQRLTQLSLGLTDYQVLLDFDGAPDSIRQSKYAEAEQMIEDALRLGATTLLVPASTHKHCNDNLIEEDLRWLTARAGRSGLRIAYEAMAWSTRINTTAAAWQLVQRIGADNLGLVVDAFHIFAAGRTLADLAGIPADRIDLVQFSDLGHQPEKGHLVEAARHQRLLPGEGSFPLHDLVDHLQAISYRGPVGLEVFNDALKQSNPLDTAHKAMTALKQLLGQR